MPLWHQKRCGMIGLMLRSGGRVNHGGRSRGLLGLVSSLWRRPRKVFEALCPGTTGKSSNTLYMFCSASKVFTCFNWALVSKPGWHGEEDASAKKKNGFVELASK